MYSGGTTGEFYAMEFDEFQAVARATVEEAQSYGKPAMVGCGSTYTLGATRRAAFASEIGANAIQLVLPYWIELGDDQVVPFFSEVSAAAGGLPLSIYETTRARKCLRADQHRAIKDAIPSYLMVKANPGSVGLTPEGCEVLSHFLNVFVDETEWPKLGPKGAAGACSWLFYWKPQLSLRLWELLRQQEWESLERETSPVKRLLDFAITEFESKGLTDTALDRFGAIASGFLRTSLHNRGPYPSATQDDVVTLRQWCHEHFPEMLKV